MGSDKIKIFLGDSLKRWLLTSLKNGDFDAVADSFGKYFDKRATQDFMHAFGALSDKLNFDDKHKDMILKALLHAHYLHTEQWRKFENKPYISHILRVSSYFANWLSENNTVLESHDIDKISYALLACLLHDSVEDQADRLHQSADRDKALAVVENQYGEQVRHYLNCLSKPEIDEDDEKTEKYKEWIKGIWESGDMLLIMIKFSDIYDNLRSSIDTFVSQDPSSLFSKSLDAAQIEVIDRAEKWIMKYKDALEALQEVYSEDMYRGAHAEVLQGAQDRAKSILEKAEKALVLPRVK